MVGTKFVYMENLGQLFCASSCYRLCTRSKPRIEHTELGWFVFFWLRVFVVHSPVGHPKHLLHLPSLLFLLGSLYCQSNSSGLAYIPYTPRKWCGVSSDQIWVKAFVVLDKLLGCAMSWWWFHSDVYMMYALSRWYWCGLMMKWVLGKLWRLPQRMRIRRVVYSFVFMARTTKL